MKPSKYLLPLLLAAFVTGSPLVEAKRGNKGGGQPTAVSLKASGAGSGAAAPGNMQWQTKRAAKQKDKTE